MKYMIMTFGGQAGLADRSIEWIKEMIDFIRQIDRELAGSGELVFQQGLADARQAKTVRVHKGVPVATDSPFAGPGQSLAGFWIVDVENPERAYALAAHASSAPGPGGGPLNMPIEVRPVMCAPPAEML